jgi:hypothetical protein
MCIYYILYNITVYDIVVTMISYDYDIIETMISYNYDIIVTMIS